MCFMDEVKSFLSSLKSNIFVRNATIMPQSSDIKNEYIQFMFELNNNAVEIETKIIKESRLNQNLFPNFKSNIFLAMRNCIAQVANWTQRLVNAAPLASNIGINIKFNVRLIITPIAATIFNCFRLPLAVSNVPKIYVKFNVSSEFLIILP